MVQEPILLNWGCVPRKLAPYDEFSHLAKLIDGVQIKNGEPINDSGQIAA